jgi:hypothetical protein
MRLATALLLRGLGAEEMAHPGGTLLAHLRRVEAKLGSWGASIPVRWAGLCHAVYGTDGFQGATLLAPGDRKPVVAAIGKALGEFFAAHADLLSEPARRECANLPWAA